MVAFRRVKLSLIAVQGGDQRHNIRMRGRFRGNGIHGRLLLLFVINIAATSVQVFILLTYLCTSFEDYLINGAKNAAHCDYIQLLHLNRDNISPYWQPYPD
jgi:hypothetical protein